MTKIEYDDLTNEEMESIQVTFIPKKCPKCNELMVCRELGVWGYYCIDCMFWWGTYDPFPKVKGVSEIKISDDAQKSTISDKPKKVKKKN